MKTASMPEPVRAVDLKLINSIVNISAMQAAATPQTAGRRRRGAECDGRERLLDAAVDLFATRGIASTTVAQIAAAGQVTSAMVHYWFDTRERLLDAVADERLAPLIQETWRGVDLHREHPLDVVRTLLQRMFDQTRDRPWLPALWLREIVQEGGLLRQRMQRHVQPERSAAFRESIAAAQARGEINPHIAPELLFMSILALVMLPQASSRLCAEFHPEAAVDRTQLERHLIGLLMEGLRGGGPT